MSLKYLKKNIPLQLVVFIVEQLSTNLTALEVVHIISHASERFDHDGIGI